MLILKRFQIPSENLLCANLGVWAIQGRLYTADGSTWAKHRVLLRPTQIMLLSNGAIQKPKRLCIQGGRTTPGASKVAQKH